jgi:hypothetical protein
MDAHAIVQFITNASLIAAATVYVAVGVVGFAFLFIALTGAHIEGGRSDAVALIYAGVSTFIIAAILVGSFGWLIGFAPSALFCAYELLGPNLLSMPTLLNLKRERA